MAADIALGVGRPDSEPVSDLAGRPAAAPILFDAFARTGKPAGGAAEAPEGCPDGE